MVLFFFRKKKTEIIMEFPAVRLIKSQNFPTIIIGWPLTSGLISHRFTNLQSCTIYILNLPASLALPLNIFQHTICDSNHLNSARLNPTEYRRP